MQGSHGDWKMKMVMEHEKLANWNFVNSHGNLPILPRIVLNLYFFGQH